jgi:hypothetical protein
LTESDGDTYAALGSWEGPDTFVIDYELIGYTNRGRWTLTFTEDEIDVEEVGVTGSYTYRGTMRQTGSHTGGAATVNAPDGLGAVRPR